MANPAAMVTRKRQRDKGVGDVNNGGSATEEHAEVSVLRALAHFMQLVQENSLDDNKDGKSPGEGGGKNDSKSDSKSDGKGGDRGGGKGSGKGGKGDSAGGKDTHTHDTRGSMNTNKRHKGPEDQSDQPFCVLEPLSFGTRTGVVQLAVTPAGEELAVKLVSYDHPEVESLLAELRNEAAMYNLLETLQGDAIGRLVFSGDIRLGHRNRLKYALATVKWGRSGTEGVQLPASLEHAAVTALRSVHSKGVLHGDIRVSNLLFLGDAVKLIDFAAARVADQVAEAGAFQAEMKHLRELFSSSPTRADPAPSCRGPPIQLFLDP
jgi:serine/threonine protein kinase